MGRPSQCVWPCEDRHTGRRPWRQTWRDAAVSHGTPRTSGHHQKLISSLGRPASTSSSDFWTCEKELLLVRAAQCVALCREEQAHGNPEGKGAGLHGLRLTPRAAPPLGTALLAGGLPSFGHLPGTLACPSVTTSSCTGCRC